MLKRKPVGMALSWSRGYICLSNQNSGCDYYSGAYERKLRAVVFFAEMCEYYTADIARCEPLYAGRAVDVGEMPG